MLSLIVAHDQNFTIGNDNDLPWPRISEDMKHFRKITKGSNIIMGRKTYESIGKPLKDRVNIILTSYWKYKAPGCVIFHSIDEIKKFERSQVNQTFIIGGKSLYRQFIPECHKLYITRIHNKYDGDTHFPRYNIIKTGLGEQLTFNGYFGYIWEMKSKRVETTVNNLEVEFSEWQRIN